MKITASKKYTGSNATAIANVVFFNSLIVHDKLPVLFSGNIISMQKYKRFLMPFFILYYLSGIFISFAKVGNYLTFKSITNIILPVVLYILAKEYN